MAGFGHDPGPGRSSTRFPGRIVNTHPALLPSFPGWHAVRDALAYGVKVTGCTVHVATEEVDAGPILAQEAVPVLEGDDEATLHERIKAVERRLYIDTIRLILGEGVRHMTDVPKRRALLSVYDKTGMVELGRSLVELGWELVSSGGTAGSWPTPACRSSTSRRSPGSPRCWATGCDPAPGQSTAASWPTGTTLAPGRHGDLRRRADRPGGGEPVPVHLRPRRSS